MVAKVGRYFSVFMLLAVFITANGLQYTHDIEHHYHYAGDSDCSSADHSDHKHPQADECALCWFVFHQISSSFVFGSLLPQIALQDHVSLLNEECDLSYQDEILCSQGNKDPPLRV